VCVQLTVLPRFASYAAVLAQRLTPRACPSSFCVAPPVAQQQQIVLRDNDTHTHTHTCIYVYVYKYILYLYVYIYSCPLCRRTVCVYRVNPASHDLWRNNNKSGPNVTNPGFGIRVNPLGGNTYMESAGIHKIGET